MKTLATHSVIHFHRLNLDGVSTKVADEEVTAGGGFYGSKFSSLIPGMRWLPLIGPLYFL